VIASSSHLRRRLFLLSVAGVLPLTVMTGLGLNVLVALQREQSRRAGLELARSVATAVDIELRSSMSALKVLATTPTLDRGDLEEFRERAQRVLDRERDWAAVVLTDRTGTALVDTRVAPGAPLPPIAEPGSLERVLRTRGAAVGDLARAYQGGWLFAVRVPVTRAGEVRYVVSALVKPEGIRTVLTRQHVPADWVISIVDANGLRVARSRAHEGNLGGRLSESVQALVAGRGAEGFGVACSARRRAGARGRR
jgi:hypothetical protein